MELKEARQKTAEYRKIIEKGTGLGLCLGTHYIAITLDDRITELEAERKAMRNRLISIEKRRC